VAAPRLRDDNFHRTVVLVLEHGEEGAVGVVLNRPSETSLGEIASELGHLAAAPGFVHVGGPVAPGAAVCLGRSRPGNHEAEGVTALFGRVMSVDLDKGVGAFGEAVDAIRLFAGYAGWAAGQLEGELEQGGWFVVDRIDEDVFSPTPDRLWRTVLRRQSLRNLVMLASFPDDPDLN